MPKKIDLTNQKFGELTVLEEGPRIITPNGRSHIAWKCQCSCGKIVNIRGDILRNGHAVSCGCKRKQVLLNAGKNRISKLIGKHFGRLIVVKDSGQRDNKGGVIWECKCSCGNITYVSTSNLTRKKNPTISCGCAKSKGEEKLIQIFITNQIPFINQKTFDDCINPNTNRHFFFDFYLPDQNVLIEYDGEQHFFARKNDLFNYEKTKIRDQQKNEWCKQHNYTLIRIPYTDYSLLSWNYIQEKIDGRLSKSDKPMRLSPSYL